MPEKKNEYDLYKQAVNALKQKVTGYSIEESKKTYVYDNGRKKVKDQTVVKKEIGPDWAAIQFVLTSLNPEQWSKNADKKTNETDREWLPDLSKLSQAALDELNALCNEE